MILCSGGSVHCSNLATKTPRVLGSSTSNRSAWSQPFVTVEESREGGRVGSSNRSAYGNRFAFLNRGGIMNHFLFALVASTAIGITAAAEPSTAVPPGTLVQLKLFTLMTTQRSQPGEVLQFEVTQDVVIHGHVVISRGTQALGSVTNAKAYDQHRPFWTLNHSHRGQLGFTISETKSVYGDVVRLSGPLTRVSQVPPRPLISWHHEGETFEAVVLLSYR